ncbi:MAG TPA: geranyl transferase [Thiothrix sp.]|nr:geranyl transferase [Thiothrix sp.]
MGLNNMLMGYQQRIESVLDNVLPRATLNPTQLHGAMRYSVLEGGKRVRPLLVYATGETLGIPVQQLDIVAASIELIHVYSLIHDDLPAMDDDDLRRNKPTCHKQYDEAIAILAGDALQALATYLLASSSAYHLVAEKRLQLIGLLSLASGSRGMAGGQAIDLASTGKELTEPELEYMHIHKTGALIRACIQMACICADDITDIQQHNLDRFAQCIGLAFQVRDDILDIESDTETLGKTQGADIAANKVTYPSILGLQCARQKVVDLHTEALHYLADFDGAADNLRHIADFIVKRLK